MEFYKPRQGDTASVVADGYHNNFNTLDTAKADAQAMSEALAGKVDKADGKDLMTSGEREKLSGIEAGANAYTHPESHPADMITDTVDKVVMTSAEREKLAGIEAGANAYTLPAATASTLGGVKAGSNVTIAEDGTLSAAAEPYELPKASASVLGGIKLGNNLTAREDGTVDAAGGGTVTVSPDSGNTLEQRANGLFVPAGSGGSGSDGGNSLLIDLTQNDEEIKTALMAFITSANSAEVAVQLKVPEGESGAAASIIPALYTAMGNSMYQITASLLGGDVLKLYSLMAGIAQNEVQYFLETRNDTLITTEALTAALEGKVSLIPESLSEQLVPGEFWLGADGVKRQVYIRTFMGTLADSSTRLISSIDAAMLVQGYMVQTIHHMPFNAVFPFSNITTALQTVAIPYVTNNVLTIYTDASGKPVGSKYVATFKYTKA